MIRSKGRMIAAAVVSATVLVACGSQTATVRAGAPVTVSEPAALGTTSPALAENGPVNPLDAWFNGTLADNDRRNNEEQMVSACMRRVGLQWVPRTYAAGEPATRIELRDYRRTKGYGINAAPDPGDITNDNDPNLAFMKSLGEDGMLRYLDALEGPYGTDGRHGGCREQVTAPDPGEVTRRGNARANQLWIDMQSSTEVVAGMTSWSQCMAAAGFVGLAGPEDARALAGGSDSVTAEVKIASADVQCAESYLWNAWRTYGDRAVAELGPP